jgi:hypothetical protein
MLPLAFTGAAYSHGHTDDYARYVLLQNTFCVRAPLM